VRGQTIGVWVSGLAACGLIGAMVGAYLAKDSNDSGGFLGAIAGVLTFACLRLWLGPKGRFFKL
jgi:uncharacterized membrane protein YfcA